MKHNVNDTFDVRYTSPGDDARTSGTTSGCTPTTRGGDSTVGVAASVREIDERPESDSDVSHCESRRRARDGLGVGHGSEEDWGDGRYGGQQEVEVRGRFVYEIQKKKTTWET